VFPTGEMDNSRPRSKVRQINQGGKVLLVTSNGGVYAADGSLKELDEGGPEITARPWLGKKPYRWRRSWPPGTS